MKKQGGSWGDSWECDNYFPFSIFFFYIHFVKILQRTKSIPSLQEPQQAGWSIQCFRTFVQPGSSFKVKEVIHFGLTVIICKTTQNKGIFFSFSGVETFNTIDLQIFSDELWPLSSWGTINYVRFQCFHYSSSWEAFTPVYTRLKEAWKAVQRTSVTHSRWNVYNIWVRYRFNLKQRNKKLKGFKSINLQGSPAYNHHHQSTASQTAFCVTQWKLEAGWLNVVTLGDWAWKIRGSAGVKRRGGCIFHE